MPDFKDAALDLAMGIQTGARKQIHQELLEAGHLSEKLKSSDLSTF
jgi:hypothetical protein